MVLSDLSEKKVVGERESRNLYVDADIMKKQMMVGVPKVSHANFVKGHAFSKNNYLSGLPAMTAEADGELWEHLMRFKAELDCLIGLTKNKIKKWI